MSELVLVLLIGGLAAGLTAVGPLIAERYDVPDRIISRALQFAAGVLTALVAFTLMPPAVREGFTPAVVGGFFIGGAAFVIMDYISARQKAQRSAEIAVVSTALYIGIIVDMLIDGVVIGLGSTLTLGAGIALALGVAISTAPLALVTTSLAKKSGESTRFRGVLFALYIAALMGGALLGFLVFRNQSVDLRLALIAMASGFLITTVTQSIIPEANRDGEPSFAALFFVGGLSLYALFTLGFG
jgi:ZIP family zinc transporter